MPFWVQIKAATAAIYLHCLLFTPFFALLLALLFIFNLLFFIHNVDHVPNRLAINAGFWFSVLLAWYGEESMP